jgi:hypothetical protein
VERLANRVDQSIRRARVSQSFCPSQVIPRNRVEAPIICAREGTSWLI